MDAFGLMDMVEEENNSSTFMAKTQEGHLKKKKPRRRGKKNVKNVKDLFKNVMKSEKKKGNLLKRAKKRSQIEIKKISDLKPNQKQYIFQKLVVIESFPEGGGVVGDSTGSISVKTRRKLRAGSTITLVLKMTTKKSDGKTYVNLSGFKVLKVFRDDELIEPTSALSDEKPKPNVPKVKKGSSLFLVDDKLKRILLFSPGFSYHFLNFKYNLKIFLKNDKGTKKDLFRKELKNIHHWTNEEVEIARSFDHQKLFPFIPFTEEKLEKWKKKYTEILKFIPEECEAEAKRREENQINVTYNSWSIPIGTITYNIEKKRMETSAEICLREMETKMKKYQMDYNEDSPSEETIKTLGDIKIDKYTQCEVFYQIVDSRILFEKLENEKQIGGFKWFDFEDLGKVVKREYILDAVEELCKKEGIEIKPIKRVKIINKKIKEEIGEIVTDMEKNIEDKSEKGKEKNNEK